MTEQEWRACTDPKAMLEFLRGKASDRKLRLFACACCRRIWHLIDDQRCRQAVEAAERYAEGRVSREELKAAADVAGAPVTRAYDATGEGVSADARYHASYVASFAYSAALSATWNFGPSDAPHGAYREALTVGGAYAAAVQAAAKAALAVANLVHASTGVDGATAEAQEEARQCGTLRDLFGIPFRPVGVDPAWLTPAVVELAQAIYDDRAFDRLPELADALEEAGCLDADILAHCRQAGEHVRGCWAVDLILGKE
jgi:hypothetical protein